MFVERCRVDRLSFSVVRRVLGRLESERVLHCNAAYSQAETGPRRRVKQATWTDPKNGDKVEVAVKCIKKKHLHGDYEAVLEEIDVLKELDHPSVGALSGPLACISV